MSGVSMNQIRSRIKSVGSTMQITRAMELVATSKLRRARESAEGADVLADAFDTAIRPLMRSVNTDDCAWFNTQVGGKVLYIVIAGDRGLAGGFNSNVLRMVSTQNDAEFIPFGKKAIEFFSKQTISVIGKNVSDTTMADCIDIAKYVCDSFMAQKFSRVELIYTRFVSILSQIPTRQTLLPLSPIKDEDEKYGIVTDEPPSQLLDALITQYTGSLIYRAVSQSAAAESASRRMAMNSANKNAEHMIDELRLNYNRARQAVITREITEIVAGAGEL